MKYCCCQIFSGDFVSTHGLRFGDTIIIYQHIANNNYVRAAKILHSLHYRNKKKIHN